MSRMRRIGWALVFAAAAAAAVATAKPARADLDIGAGTDTIEEQQRVLALRPWTVMERGYARWRAFAQLAGEGAAELAANAWRITGAGAAVGAELRVASDRCDLVRVGGQARLAWSGGARPSAEQWASGCLTTTFSGVELGHHFEWDVRPSLLAPIQLRTGLNRRETLSFHLETFRLPLALLDAPQERPPYNAIVLFGTELHASWMWSADTPLAWHLNLEAVGIRYKHPEIAPWGEHRDYQVDVLAAGAEFTTDGSTIAAWVVRISNLALGRAFVTGGIGISSVGIGPIIMDGDIARHQLELTTPRALLAVETGGDRLHGYVRGTNDFRIVADGYIVRDSRLAGGLALDAASARVGLDGYVGFTKLYRLDTAPVGDMTGGARLSLTRGVGAHLEAALLLEAARSFYALAPEPMAGALGPPRWGLNVMAALQAMADR
jgi:hypothetical protein